MIMIQPDPSFAGVWQQLSDEQRREIGAGHRLAVGVPHAALGEVLVRPVPDPSW